VPVADGGQVRGKGRDRDEDEVEETTASEEVDEDLLDDVDGLLDEIDDVLEENAEEFVKNYVQKGGQ
jgi:prokaryotic ubiquitin-like protein Pup